MEFNYKNIIKVKNKRIRRILDICDRKDKEIKRLNNIINALKELELYVLEYKENEDYELVDNYTLFDMETYIEELKGSDKE